MIYNFDTTLSLNGWTGALLIPEDIAAQLALNNIKRVVATATAAENKLTLYAGVIKQKGVVYLMFSKANQKKLEVTAGDILSISMHEDSSRYQAPMTEELEAVLLSDYEAYELFGKLQPGKQRNIIFMVYGIKDSQKRIDLSLNIMENLKVGNKNPFKFEKLL